MSRRRINVAVLATFVLLAVLPAAGVAAPGDPVEGFGTYAPGVSVTDVEIVSGAKGDYSWIMGMALGDDGKITALGGHFRGEKEDDFAFARYLPDGSLDTSFSDDGMALFDLLEGSENDANRGVDVVVQPDGKAVAVGYVLEYSGPFCTGYYCLQLAIVRLTPEGDLDPAFGDGGTVLMPIGDPARQAEGLSDDYANAVALQADGSIVIAATDSEITVIDEDEEEESLRSAVVRLLPDGTPDPGFGTDGVVATNFLSDGGEPTYEEANDVLIDQQGRILLAVNNAVVRLLPDGEVDDAYGVNGVALLPEVQGYLSLARQSGNRVIAAASGRVWRLLPGGNVDESFGTEGEAKAPLDIDDVTVGPGDVIDVAGGNGRIAQLLPDGEIDYGFSRCGFLALPTPPDWDDANSILMSGEDIIVGGSAVARGLTYGSDGFAIARIEGGASPLVGPVHQPDLWMSWPKDLARGKVKLDPKPVKLYVPLTRSREFSFHIDNFGHPTDTYSLKMIKGPGRFKIDWSYPNGNPETLRPCESRYMFNGFATATGSNGDQMTLEFRATSQTDPTKVDVFRLRLITGNP